MPSDLSNVRCEDLQYLHLSEKDARGRHLARVRGYYCRDKENERARANWHKGERVAHGFVEPGGWLGGMLRISKAGWVEEGGQRR